MSLCRMLGEETKESATAPPSVGEKTILFVGEKRSGKTSLIAKFLGDPVKEDTTETTALDFKFGKRQVDDKSQKVSMFELGGGRSLADMLSVCLTPRSVSSTVVCITVDLTRPGNAVDSVLFWLNVVREQTQQVLQMNMTHQSEVQNMNRRLQSVWADHEDRSRVELCPVPIMICGTKYDAFANTHGNVTQKKQLCLAMRHIAH